MLIPRMRHTNQSGQVLLETVIVFLALVILAIAAVGWFSNLNLNQLHRIDLYRKTRLDAVNNPARLSAMTVNTTGGMMSLAEPKTFLKYFPDQGLVMTPGEDINPAYFDDHRIVEAELLLDRQDGILNVIIPYRVTQAYNLNQTVYWNGDWNDGPLVPRKTVNAIVNLMGEGANEVGGNPDADDNPRLNAYDSFVTAIEKFKAVLNSPLVPGPFDPNPTPANYNLFSPPLSPDELARQLAAIQSEHDYNRQNIQDTINSLEGFYDKNGNWVSGAKKGLHIMIYGTEPPDEPAPIPPNTRINTGRGLYDYYLLYIKNNYDDPDWRLTRYAESNKRLKELYENVGLVTNVVRLSPELVNEINGVYNILKGDVAQIPYSSVQDAKALSSQIAASPEISSIGGGIKAAANDLDEKLGDAITRWNEPAVRFSDLTDAHNDAALLKNYSDQTNVGNIGGVLANSLANSIKTLYLRMQGDLSSKSNVGDIKLLSEALLNDPLLQKETILYNVAQRADSDLEASLKNWDEDVEIRNDYLEFAKGNIWILYEVTDVNWML
ncbi:MAG: hypothetical protein PHN57_08140 [Candidatus Omnitrophica bacterium]|nr:hypothetical protein [Candidatus Omnitrophota bacterium]